MKRDAVRGLFFVQRYFFHPVIAVRQEAIPDLQSLSV